MRAFGETSRIMDIIQREIPPQCAVQGRFYRRKDGQTRFALAVLTPTPKRLVTELLNGDREVIHTGDIPDNIRVDEAVVNRIRAALKGIIKLEPIMADRRRYKGQTPSGVSVTINTHICNGDGLKIKARTDIGYFLSCTT